METAIVGIDLPDKKQMVVVTDHDSKVLARDSATLLRRDGKDCVSGRLRIRPLIADQPRIFSLFDWTSPA